MNFSEERSRVAGASNIQKKDLAWELFFCMGKIKEVDLSRFIEDLARCEHSLCGKRNWGRRLKWLSYNRSWTFMRTLVLGTVTKKKE